MIKIFELKWHLAVAGTLAMLASPSFAAEEVNVYSARHYDTDLALYRTFTEQTGIRVNLIEGDSDALMERIINEGEFTPADLLITVDAGRLWRAQQRGVFQAIDSDVLDERVPKNLQEPNGEWFGLSTRARVVVYNKAKPLPIAIKTYDDLANPKLRGKICMRSSSNIYNLSLMASLIAAEGEAAAAKWAEGVVANFARRPQGNDSSNLSAVAAGECGLTLANTYYIGRWLASDAPADRKVTEALAVVFPNQDDRGTHVNISGAGVTKHAPHKANAIKFLEYLTSDYAQRLFAEGNNEYPVVGKPSGPITQLGDFTKDDINAAVLGENQARAVQIFDKAGWR